MQDILSENRHSASELSYYFQMKGRKQMAQVNLEIATCTAHKKAPRHSSKHQDAFSASAIQTGDYACAGAPTGQTSAQAPHSHAHVGINLVLGVALGDRVHRAALGASAAHGASIRNLVSHAECPPCESSTWFINALVDGNIISRIAANCKPQQLPLGQNRSWDLDGVVILVQRNPRHFHGILDGFFHRFGAC